MAPTASIARIDNAIRHRAERIFRQAHAEGRREPSEAYAYDAALELVTNRTTKAPFPADGPDMTRLLDILAELGMLTRADTNLYLAPPLCIQRQEIDRLVAMVDTGLSRFEQECGYL